MIICIIGSGIIGLNIAYALCKSRPPRGSSEKTEIYLFEQEPYLGHHASTRNSEVIHAGLAYPPGSLKSKLCIEGNRLTYEILDELKVPLKKCGKWIIAIDDKELAALENMIGNAHRCGSETVHLSTVQKAQEAEPALHNIIGAAFSPETGIMDTAAYIKALEIALSHHKNMNFVYPCKVTGMDDKHIETTRGTTPYDIAINAAGLFADHIYKLSGGQRGLQIIPYKGEYYIWRKGKVNTLIYPVPRRFLEVNRDDLTKTSNFGIHAHKSISGDVMIGPSQIRLSPEQKTDYSITSSADSFAEAVAPYIKGINGSDLIPAQAGNRAKLFENDVPFEDFQIFREGNIIHLLGIESPGLTAAPAIAGHVKDMIW